MYTIYFEIARMLFGCCLDIPVPIGVEFTGVKGLREPLDLTITRKHVTSDPRARLFGFDL